MSEKAETLTELPALAPARMNWFLLWDSAASTASIAPTASQIFFSSPAFVTACHPRMSMYASRVTVHGVVVTREGADSPSSAA